jgi:hypothetical protein
MRVALLTALSVALGGVAVVWGTRPLLRSLARARAHAQGFDFDAKRARFGWGVVRFGDASLSSASLPGVTASFDEIVVVPSFTFGVRRIEVHGGRVRLAGSLRTLENELDSFRPARSTSDAHTAGERVPVVVDGLDVAWDDATNPGNDGHLWGARYRRSPDSHEALGADLARFAMNGASVEVARPEVELSRVSTHRVLDHVSAASLDATVDLDEAATLLATASDVAASPGTVPATKALDATPAKHDPTAIAPPENTTDPSSNRGPRWRAELRRGAAALSSMLRSGANAVLQKAHVRVQSGAEALNLGPADLVVARDDVRVHVSFAPGMERVATPLRIQLDLPIGDGPVDVGLDGGPISLGLLGVKEGDLGLENVDRAEVEATGKAQLSADGRSLSVSGRSRFVDVAVFQRKLAPEPVRDVQVGLSGELGVELDGSRIDLRNVTATVGRVTLETSGTLERGEDYSRGGFHVEAPLAACADILGSTPPALVPLLQGLEASGTFAFSGDLGFDTRRPADTRVDWKVANGCRVTEVPEGLSPARFEKPWVRSVLDKNDEPMTIESGPGTSAWVALRDISPFMPTAILVCEDSRFFSHSGFDEKAIHDSIRDNLRAGKFVRGASTVSMQLAKNLYLGREKTLSRKLQEAVLTLLLEQSLTKEQILELYLNVIEFSPGVYGIGPAAAYYFHSDARDLSLAQALYLGSILPNPKHQHFGRDGAIHPAWGVYLQHLMQIAHKVRRIDDHELEVGLGETVQFGAPAQGDEIAPASDVDPRDGEGDADVGPDYEPSAP